MKVLQKEIMICLGIAIDVRLLAHCISSTWLLLLDLCWLCSRGRSFCGWIGRSAWSSPAEKSCRFNLHTLKVAFDRAKAIPHSLLNVRTVCFCCRSVGWLGREIYLVGWLNAMDNPLLTLESLYTTRVDGRTARGSWKWNCCKYGG